MTSSQMYPHTSIPHRREIRDVLLKGPLDGEWTIAGRIVGRRSSGQIVFFDVRDWSGQMQVIQRSIPASRFNVGDIVSVQGRIYITKRNEEITLEASKIRLLSKSMRPPPDRRGGVQDAGTRYRHRELDLIGNDEARRVFAGRARIVAAIREWLAAMRFVEVETPMLQPRPGGANVRPFRTHHNALMRDMFLRISVELYVNRCVVGGMDRVYDMGKVFRNEGLSPKHSPEFTVIEWFMSYLDYRDIAVRTEDMLRFVAKQSMGRTTFTCRGQEIDLAAPWRRVTFRDLILDETGVDVEHLPAAHAMELYATVEPKLVQPTLVFDFPLDPFPITKRHRDNPLLGEHFDAVIGGIEIASGDTELNDPHEQRDRFITQYRDRGVEHSITGADKEYIEALECGYPPTAGVGMGIDRLVMILLEKDHIRDVIPFPIVRPR